MVFEKDLSERFLHFDPDLEIQDLIAHWPFDEGSGFICRDWSENNLDAYLTGNQWNTRDGALTSSYRKKGMRGGCIYLNGTQWLQVQNVPVLNPENSFSILLWLKPDDIEKFSLLSKCANREGFQVLLEQDGSFSFKYYDKHKKTHRYNSPRGIIVSNEWQQIGVSYDKNEEIVELIYNGLVIDKIPFSDGFISSIVDLSIAGSEISEKCFKGSVDELSFFGEALNKREISRLYTVGMPKIYLQTRETIDSSMSVWNYPHGNEPVPHPLNNDVLLSLRFDGTTQSVQGQWPENSDEGMLYSPAAFGAALNAKEAKRGLYYSLKNKLTNGSFEAWVQLPEKTDVLTPMASLIAENHSFNIHISCTDISLNIQHDGKCQDSLVIEDVNIPEGKQIHIALCWKIQGDSILVKLFLNGVEKNSKLMNVEFKGFENLWIGGDKKKNFTGLIDDVCVSRIAKGWGAICPRGIIDNESPSIDLMHSFDNKINEALMHWTSFNSGKWNYGLKPWDNDDEGNCISQNLKAGMTSLYHPDAFGFNSSFESGVSVDSINDGWAGVFVQSSEVSEGNFSGHAFMINYFTNEVRISSFLQGVIVQEKILKNDFQFKNECIYLLTLSAVDGLLRAYIDNRNVISMVAQTNFGKGFAGLITIDTNAFFDDIHFSALTPSAEFSRKVAVNTISEGEEIGINKLSINAFRWKKRYGLLPWERDFKNPEPPGNIFGPDDKTIRPNSSKSWRSEDAANSCLRLVNGTFYYFMRGNPDIKGKHGNAQIGVLSCDSKDFDGIHFNDYNQGQKMMGTTGVLKGHQDNNADCSDDIPRNSHFQLNDQSCVYIDGKILMVCREFRNSNNKSNKFKRLVLGAYLIHEQTWEKETPDILLWSYMDPDSCFGHLNGIDATPEIILLRDPVSDKHNVFLYHHTYDKLLNDRPSSKKGSSSVSGFYYDGNTLVPDDKYPEKLVIVKSGKDALYGERILFDNGIWFMNVNAHSVLLDKDWPDRFELYTSLDPYQGPWCPSSDNYTDRPYFTRGDQYDPDNGAIWQGEMLKYRNHYYMYYENYHVINDPEKMYENYDHPQTGSRVGLAVGN